VNVICKQSSTGAFKKISITPRTTRKSHVKDPFSSAFEPRDDFLGGGDKAERSREVIGCTQRKNAQRNAAIDETESNLCNRPVTTGGKHQVSRLLERLLKAGFFRGLVSGVMSRFGQCRHQLLPTMLRVTSLGIVYQRDSHQV
jgi:hypothetical protein